MVISVKVRLIGIYRLLSGKSKIRVELEEEPAVVRKVIQKLVEVFSPDFKDALIDPELKDPRPNALILVNGKEISILDGLETKIDKGDEIVLVPVSHGG